MLSGEIPSDVARVAINAINWQMMREAPKQYGDRITQEHTGGVKVEVVYEDLPPKSA